jgi:hypothetical protein
MTTHPIITQHLWHPAEKIIFRFFCLFFVLTLFPFPLDFLPWAGEKITKWYAIGKQPIIQFLGNHLLGISGEIKKVSYGSGDTTYDWVDLVTVFLLTSVGIVLWSVFGRNRATYQGAMEWLSVYIRYYLVMTMFSYGFSKIFFHFLSPFALLRIIYR